MGTALRPIHSILFPLLLAAGCADLERGPRPVDGRADDAPAADGGGVTFAAARALLVEGCARCHAPGQSADRTGFVLADDAAADHRAARAFVDEANPAASRLLTKAAGVGHGGGTIFPAGSPEHAVLLGWIQAGAPP